MTDEEKKAFESVKDMFSDVTIKDIDEQSITIYGLAMLDVIKVLTIVEKQSKEIEHQKEKRENQKKELAILKRHRQILNNVEFGKFPYDKNYQVKIEAGRQQGKSFRAGMEFSNKIWEDKIKAKIEELEKQDRENRMSHNYLVIPVLQSLLEKEE